MPYVAHAGVQLSIDTDSYEKGKWYFIKKTNDIEYRWRLSKDLTYDVIGGVFDDKHKALQRAKQMYVTLFYTLMSCGITLCNAGCEFYESRFFDKERDNSLEEFQNNELFFFWDKKHQGGRLGPGVFEVDNSIEEFNDYKFVTVKIGAFIYDTALEFDNVNDYIFTYCRKSQSCFNTFLLAENALEIGMSMTIYCGLLEHLSEESLKDPKILIVLDSLMECVDKTELTIDQKTSLKNYLNAGKNMSARQKCLELCKKYAESQYGQFTYKEIIDEAYSIRSAFSHGEDCDNRRIKCAHYIKYVVLDVIKNYMREYERGEKSEV